jgi:hypothetical protein
VLAPPVVAPASARTSLAITVYAEGGERHQGFAFVREERRVRVPGGRFVLSAPDISSKLVPETTRFELVSLDEDGKAQPAAELYEQRYLYDTLGPSRLLEKAEGQRVTVTRWAGGRRGREVSVAGTIVSSKQGVVLRLDSGETVAFDAGERFAFARLPADLVDRPTLSWNVGSYEPADARLRLSYRTDGFSWQADYVLGLDRAGRAADVEGWVTVTNASDTSFEGAKLQLAAGEVHTVRRGRVIRLAEITISGELLPNEPPKPRATAESLGEIHLYTVDHPTDVPARSTKQVRFVVARAVPVEIETETIAPLGATGKVAAWMKVKVAHPHAGPLAVPLPAGTVRTSATSASGVRVQVGEAAVEHCPVGEPWRVPVAQDADQITHVKLSNAQRLGRDADGALLQRFTLDYEMRNASDQPRRRRLVLDPQSLRLVRLVRGDGVRLEGPTRAVIEAELGPRQARSWSVVLDVVDPHDVSRPGFSLPFFGSGRRGGEDDDEESE